MIAAGAAALVSAGVIFIIIAKKKKKDEEKQKTCECCKRSQPLIKPRRVNPRRGLFFCEFYLISFLPKI